jgi:nucleoside-diphosphate-sugar epimerase
VCPVDPASWMPLLSPRRCVAAFIHAHDLPDTAWGWNRALLLPSLDVTVKDIGDGLKRVAGQKAYDLIEWKIDPMIQKIVAGWPKRMAAKRSLAMGFTVDASVDELIQNYIDDDMPKA